MNWFFKLVFLGTIWSAVYVEEILSSENVFFPKLEVIESFFQSSFENASHKKSFDGGRLRTKEMPLDILSYRQHGFHSGNAESLKLECVWNAMSTLARHLPQIVASINESRAMIDVRTLCSNHAWENCGLDMNNETCDPNQEYRSIDGNCNNLHNTRWGSAPQPFERYVPSDYGDDVSSFRRSHQGQELPNPRKISRALSSSREGPQPEVTLMMVHWGQFIDHDLTLTPEREIGTDPSGVPRSACISIGGKCLTFSTERLSWNDAKESCSIQNGRLATLNDPQAFKTYFNSHYGGSDQFWLGGSDITNEGTWVWLNGQPLGDNFPWHYGEPNAYYENEDCLVSWGDALIDEPCPRQYYYVCEIDPIEESSTMECCNEGHLANSVSLGVDCVPINVTGDSFYAQDNRECIRFVRSMPALRGCDYSPMEQINRNTAFVDGSMLYGSEADVADFVRTGEKGLLNTTSHVGNGQPLPPRGGDGLAHQCPVPESMSRCFLAGDVRVDEIPGLTAMHTTFIRLHNVIADELCELNPEWCNNDEKLFQETRRIVIALVQQITYRDFLPLVVGQTLMDEHNLNPASQGYRDTYDQNVNPTVRNVFATAAFRFGHTLIADTIKAAQQENNLDVPGHFFNINVVGNITTSPSSLLKGLTRCPAAPVDTVVEEPFTNNLFADEPAGDGNFYGLDLVSINIQRGRDHGIPGFREWRTFCGLDDMDTFYKLNNIMSSDLVETFKQIYQQVDDIDLFPAGLAENPIADGILGPTFSCIIARQFANMKHGDRFWYEREDQPKPFTPDQLSSIRSQDLASILCRVSEHTSFGFQPNPFLVETEGNSVRSCSSYSFINLQPWKEQDWLFIGGQYFTISDERGLTWALANERCNSQNARLAVLDNNQDMYTYLFSNYATSAIWVGASDINHEGTFTWINGQPLADGFPWGAIEPNGGVNENCVAWWYHHGFNDAGCSWTGMTGYMCEHDPECPSPWFRIGNQCFYVEGSDYNNLNWTSARAFCGTLAPGGDLAQPRDIQALADYLFPIHHTYYWLGGSDLDNEGQWLWLDGTTVTGWRQNQPDDAEDGEDCLTIHPVWGANSLYDWDCGVTQYMKLVCERP